MELQTSCAQLREIADDALRATRGTTHSSAGETSRDRES